MSEVYLDYNASAPTRPEVIEAVSRALGPRYGNASSIHQPGHRAKVLLESARESVATLLGAASPGEVLFTSGGTEANNLGILGVARKRRSGHIIVSRIEHSSVLEAARGLEEEGFRISRISPGRDGVVDPEALLAAVEPDTFLLSLMHSSNELGTLQEIERVAAGLRGRGIVFHCDAVQSAGKVPLDVQGLGVDLLSLSGHKIGGPQGVGGLWVREGLTLTPLLRGGGQENNRRAGTEALALIAGFGEAATRAAADMPSEIPRIRALRDRLEAEMGRRFAHLSFHGQESRRLPNTVSVAVHGFRGEDLVMALDLEGIAVSTGSACAAGTVRPSHVLEAIGCSSEEARSTLRISLGHRSCPADLESFVDALGRIVGRSRPEAARQEAIPSPAGRSLP